MKRPAWMQKAGVRGTAAMSRLLGPNGEPINPAAYYQLVPDEVLNRIYDASTPMRRSRGISSGPACATI